MPAVSKKQQRFFGIVRAIKKGVFKGEKTPEIQRVASSISDKDSKSCVITERSPNSMIILLFFESDRISINICISSISTDGVKFPKYSAPIWYGFILSNLLGDTLIISPKYASLLIDFLFFDKCRSIFAIWGVISALIPNVSPDVLFWNFTVFSFRSLESSVSKLFKLSTIGGMT